MVGHSSGKGQVSYCSPCCEIHRLPTRHSSGSSTSRSKLIVCVIVIYITPTLGLSLYTHKTRVKSMVAVADRQKC